MNDELKALLEEAYNRGASKSDLDQIVNRYNQKKKEPSEASDSTSLEEPSASDTSAEVPAPFGEVPKFEGTKDKEPPKTRQQVIEEQRAAQAQKFADIGSYVGQSIAEGVVSANTFLNRAVETLLLGNNTNYFSSNSAKLLEPLNQEKERLQSEYVGEETVGKGIVETFQENPLTGAKLIAFEAGRQVPQMYAMGAIGRATMAAEGATAAGLRTGSILAPRTKLVKKIAEDVAPMVPLGMSSAGQAYLDAAEKNPEDDFIDAVTNLAVATYKGTGEIASELMFRTSVDDLIRGGFRKGLVSDIAKSTRPTLQAAKQVGKDVATEGFQEGLEELAVEISSNAMDALVFGEDMFSKSNVYGMADAFILGSAIGSPITLLSKGPSAIGTANNINKRRNISEEINDLYDVHQDPNTSASEKAVVKGQIINKLAELKQVENNLASFYEEFSEEDRNNVISLNQELSMAQLIYPELKNEQSKDALQEKVKQIYSEKTKIESKYDPNIKVYEYDRKEETGVPSPVAEGEAAVEAQPVEGAGKEATPADRVLQAREKLILESIGMDATLQAVERGEEVEQSDVDAAQERILQLIDDVDKSDIPADAKQAYIQTLEDKFDELEYYDNKTITTTEQVTEEVPVGAPRAGSRTVIEPEVRLGKLRLFEKLNNVEVDVGTEAEGQTSVMETQEDGSIDVVTYDKASGQEVGRQARVADNVLGLEYVESIFDADGNLTGVVMRPKTPKGQDISSVRLSVLNRPELAMDIAIDARKKQIGDVPEVIWLQEYETITREVTTKEKVPAKERQAAEPVAEPVAEPTTEKAEEKPVREKATPKGVVPRDQATAAVSMAKKLLARLGLKTKVVVHNSREDFDAAMNEVSASGASDAARDGGRFIPSRNEIHINLEDMLLSDPFHEVFHAAFVSRFSKGNQQTREKVASEFKDGILRVLRTGSAQDKQLADEVEQFVNDGEYTAKESPEEFIAQTAGMIALSGNRISKSTMDKLIQWLNNFIGKISPALKLNTRGEFIDFMNSFSGALFDSSIDDQTHTGLESEATTSIPSVSESSSRKGKDDSYVNRTFDKEKIQFADLSEYVGKPAITYAMDLAVTGTVKSPTGVTYTFDGGVFYPLLGEGGWAFTDEKTAKKILSKLKKFDGRVLLMSQDSRGIRGNFQFWGYMLEEVNKAVKDKRATEAELVEYINSKLKKKPIQSALEEKGLPLQIKKLSELKNLMPNDGPKKVGYEVRAEFNEALFSAEANKRFGLPRVETILDYVNEPLLANAQYGDIVAVLEFDPKKMEVKDSRTIEGAKVHPAYPWIITGFKDLKILNEFVDVRNVFGDYRSKMAEEKGDPKLKKRIKIRAARAVVTGGASANNLEINNNIVKSIVGIAPYRAKYVNEISEARDEYKKPSFERFVKGFRDIAKKFDVQVYGIEKTIGGWYDSELNSVTQEVSMRPAIAGNKEDILAMSAVAGIMAPVKKEDFQNGVMLVEYKSGAEGSEVTFNAKSDASAKQIINALNDYGFGGGFTYVVSDKSFSLAMIPSEEISMDQLRDNLDNLLTFAQENNLIDEKSIKYYEAEIKFPNSDRESEDYYGRILQEARDSKRYEGDGREGALKLLNQALEIIDERNNALDSELSESSSRRANKPYDELLDSSSKEKVQLGFQASQINYDIEDQLADSKSWQQRDRTPMERYTDLARIAIQDRLYGVIQLQEDVEYSTGKPVGLDQDFRNAEILMHGKAANDIAESTKKAEDVVANVKKAGVTLEEFDDLLYALHAQERNRYIRVQRTDIAESITDLRKKNNLKPSEAAQLAGIDPETYRELEAGTAKGGISTKELNDILSIYGLTPNQFFTQYTRENAGSGMTDAEAQAILNSYGLDSFNPNINSLKPALRDAVKGTQEIIADTRSRMFDFGLETFDTLLAFEDTYKYYVPLRGFEGEDSASEIIGGGRGLEVRGREKRAMGRKSKADSPFLNAVAQNQSTIIRARKNEVAQKLYKLAKENPNDDIWKVIDPSVNKEYKKKATTKGIKDVAKTISDYVLDDRNFAVRIDGEYKFVQFADPKLAEALRGANVVKADFLVKSLGRFNRLLSSFITTYDPEFVLRNFSRDIQVAVVNAVSEQEIEGGLLKGKNITSKIVKSVFPSIKAIFKMSGKDAQATNEFERYYSEFIEDGAKTEWFYSKSVDELRKDVDKLMSGKGDGALQAAGNFVERINTSVENGVRLAAYIESRKAGLAREKAAELAKGLTVNFNKSGSIGPVANSLYLFFNASVQGTSRLVRSLKPQFKKNEDGTRSLQVTNAQKIAISMFVAGSIMSVINELISDDDEDDKSFYSKIPDFEKERNIIIMAPNGKDYIKIPLPYGFNVFYVAGNAMADAGQGIKSVGEVASNIFEAAIGSFSPINFPSSEDLSSWLIKFVTPTIGQIPLSLALNEDYFGRTIYNENFPTDPTPKPESELGRKGATPQSVWIAKQLNKLTGGSEFRSGIVDINPDKIDFVLETLSGGAGRFGLRTTESVSNVVTGNWDQMESNQVPFARVFYGQPRKFVDLQSYFDRRIEVNQFMDEAKANKLEPKDASKVRSMYVVSKSVDKALRNIRKMEKAAENIKDENTKEDRLLELERMRYAQLAKFQKAYENYKINEL
jgi:transcriptional regulator with XRE-family HTH domain